MSTRIAFLGLGAMGSRMAARLLQAGHVNAGQEPLLNDGEAAFLSWVTSRAGAG